MAIQLRTLGWDYVMFVVFIAFTVMTPLWKRLFGAKKQRSKADYVFATGGVSLIAVMLSIARGTLGVRTVLGYPSELFYRGSAMWETIYGMMCAYPIVCFIFVPVYFNLGITSVYQYIDLRFKSRLVRCLASATYIVRQICSLGITVYTPSVALAAVIGIPYWASIIGMGTICIFFSIMGGLKAAINADVIQTGTVIFVTLAVIIRGAIVSGGPQRVYELNRDNGRLKFFNFTGDMSVRVDTTSAWLGQLFTSLSQFGCQQNFMQRFVSLKSLKEVNRVMMSNIPIIFFFFSLSWLSGMVIYSTYVDCDPYADGYIRKQDEILPFFVEDQLSIVPGFLGIFMATLFNGALCMMVSNLNSLATVTFEDFVSLLPHFRTLGDKQQLGALKVMTVIYGIIIMGVAFGVGMLSGVIESSMMAFSATSGPLLGCFILAMLIPIANWKGTSAGMITAVSFILWIIGGSVTVQKNVSNEFLPTSTEGCANFTYSEAIYKPDPDTSWLLSHSLPSDYRMPNDTLMTSIAPPVTERAHTPLDALYSVSYMYYSLLGASITVLVGILGSYLTRDEKDSYDAKLLHPLVLKLSERFGGKKPYYFSKDDSDLSVVTQHENDTAAKVNHAFDAPTESNDKTSKSPIDVVFTQSPFHATNGAVAIGELPRAEVEAVSPDGKSGTYRPFTDKDVV